MEAKFAEKIAEMTIQQQTNLNITHNLVEIQAYNDWKESYKATLTAQKDEIVLACTEREQILQSEIL